MRSLTLGLAFIATTASAADVTLTWQGRLTDSIGQPINGQHDIELSLFDGAGDSVADYDELFEDIDIVDGYVALHLGANGGLDASIIPTDAYVGVVIDTTNDMGRMPLGVAPIAAVALQSTVGDGSASSSAALSCRHILESGNSTGSGLYFIDPDGPNGVSAYSAWCDMETYGGGWTLVWRKQGASFNPITASTSFNATCAGSTTGDCASLLPPGIMWREAMFRFEDTDAYVTIIEQMEDWQRGFFNGYPWQDTNHEVIHGIKSIVNGSVGVSGAVDLYLSETSGVSETHSGSDRYIDLWDSTDATNNYLSTDASSLNGRKCIAGYCRNETVLFMVR